MYNYDLPHPALSVDTVVFGFDGVGLNIMLVEYSSGPCKGSWGLPGDFLHDDETIEQCAGRALSDTTGISGAYMDQFRTFSDPARYPGERVVSVAFLALVCKAQSKPVAGDGVHRCAWFPMEELPENIALDHDEIINKAYESLKTRVNTSPVVFYLLNPQFSVSELQRILEVINGTQYDRRNFYRKAISTGLLVSEGLARMRAAHRPPQLFSFGHELYAKYKAVNPGADYPFRF